MSDEPKPDPRQKEKDADALGAIWELLKEAGIGKQGRRPGKLRAPRDVKRPEMPDDGSEY